MLASLLVAGGARGQGVSAPPGARPTVLPPGRPATTFATSQQGAEPLPAPTPEEGPAPVDPRDAVTALRVLEAARHSATSRETVALAGDSGRPSAQ